MCVCVCVCSVVNWWTELHENQGSVITKLVVKVQTVTIWKGEVLDHTDGPTLGLATFSLLVCFFTLSVPPILRRVIKWEKAIMRRFKGEKRGAGQTVIDWGDTDIMMVFSSSGFWHSWRTASLCLWASQLGVSSNLEQVSFNQTWWAMSLK